MKVMVTVLFAAFVLASCGEEEKSFSEKVKEYQRFSYSECMADPECAPMYDVIGAGPDGPDAANAR